MRRVIKTIAFIGLLFLVLIFLPVTGNYVVRSVELKALWADQVIVGRVTDVRPSDIPRPDLVPQGQAYEDVTVLISDVLKGTPGQAQLTFSWRRYLSGALSEASAEEWKKSGHEMVFFLDNDGGSIADVNLTHKIAFPIGASDSIDLVTAQNDGTPVIARDKKMLQSGAEILAAIKGQLANPPPSRTSFQRINIDPVKDRPTYQAIWASRERFVLWGNTTMPDWLDWQSISLWVPAP